jgi:hypothetical protein
MVAYEVFWLRTTDSTAFGGNVTSARPRGPVIVLPRVVRTFPRSSLKCRYSSSPTTFGK